MVEISFIGNLSIDKISVRGFTKETFGGAALYGSLASALFNSKTGLMSIIGTDFPPSVMRDLSTCQIDLSGIKKVDNSSIRFHIVYSEDMSLESIKAYNLDLSEKLINIPFPQAFLNSKIVNITPNNFHTQKVIITRVKKEIPLAKISLQSHAYHLKRGVNKFKALLKDVDYLFLNEREARFLSNKRNILDTAKRIALQVKFLACITRGPKGAIVATKSGTIFQFSPSALEVTDPTGAGDSFVGGFLATLLRERNIVPATINGFTASGIALSGFGPCKLLEILKKKYLPGLSLPSFQ